MPARKSKPYLRGWYRRTPRGTWAAGVYRGLKQYRKTLPTETAARAWIELTLASLDTHSAPLSPYSTQDARQALTILPAGITLTEAARFYAEARGPVRSVPLDEAITQFLAEKTSAGLRPRSLRLLRSQLHHLTEHISGPLDDISPSSLVSWLDSHGYAGKTRAGYRGTLSAFFGWCVRMGYRRGNPAIAITPPVLDQQLPGILSVEDVSIVFRAAHARRSILIPYLALGFFAGLRTAELERLEWGALAAEHIHIGPAVAKSRQQRFVSVSQNLRAWLDEYRGTGPICPVDPTTRGEALLSLRRAAGITIWPHNAARHSFATYHLALHQDAPRTAHELGHANPAMLYQHYRNLATPADARAYFDIRPD